MINTLIKKMLNFNKKVETKPAFKKVAEVKKVEAVKPAEVKKETPKKLSDAQRINLLERKLSALSSKVEKLASVKAKK